MEYKRFDLNAKIVNNHVIQGFANVYDILDCTNDIVKPGAMRDTLEQAKQQGILPALLLEHDIGLFAGLWLEMIDSEKGLLVNGKILSETPGGALALEGLYNRSLTALSIGFDVEEYHYITINSQRVRVITKLALFEVSLVRNPANKEAIITNFKEMINENDCVVHETEEI